MNAQQVADLITQTVSETTRSLKAQIDELALSLANLTSGDSIIPYTDIEIDPLITGGEPLDVVKCLPTFDGSNYVSWRTAVQNCMKIYEPVKGGSRYYAVTNIIRNKVIGAANDILTSHGTPLNVDAIIGRLDITYEDKRPIHMLQSELSNLRQGKQSLQEFYDHVSKTLTLITNKTIMTYGPHKAETSCLINVARDNALRTFILGLNQPISQIVFSLNPLDLPNALARAQEIESNMYQYKDNQHSAHRITSLPPRFNYTSQPRQVVPAINISGNNNIHRQNFTQNSHQRMDIPSSGQFRRPTQHNALSHSQNQNRNTFNHPPRNFNTQNQYNPFKRERAPSDQIPTKAPRLHHLNENDDFLE